MSLPALARTFQHVDMTLRAEQPSPLKAGVVLRFSLAQINKAVKDAVAALEEIRVAVAGATAAVRKARTEHLPAADDETPFGEIDAVLAVDDVFAVIDGVGAKLKATSLSEVTQALRDAAPKLERRSAEERRYVRRLASRTEDADKRFAFTRSRFSDEVGLLRASLQEAARTAVAEALSHPEFNPGNFEPEPTLGAPDYSALRRSISRRFEKTLARLAE